MPMLEKLRPEPRRAPPSFGEFVALIGLMTGITAFSIDNLLPSFPLVEASFHIAEPNRLQLLITVYMVGFAAMQLLYGPLSDIVGRRPAALAGLAVYAAGCLLAAVAPSFEVLLLARAVQGMGAAAPRVLAIAIVRDRFEGRDMARVMSLTMMVFIIVPVLAPGLGALILLFGGWHLIFISMLLLALVVVAWFGARMPETLHPEYRVPFSTRRIVEGFRLTLASRVSVGYATAVALMLGCIMAYVGSAEQIFEGDVYKLGPLFPVAFGGVAVMMGAGSLLNARLVRRVGMRRISHAGLLGLVAISALHLALALATSGRPPLVLFGAVLGLSQFLISLTLPNFNAMAMEPLGAVAGTASSLIGFYTTLTGALLGMAIGQAFRGSVVPLALGYLILSVLCVIVLLWTERGRLMRPHHANAKKPG